MERFFRLRENKTGVRTEILAGFTTFMTMAYIIALNPNLLTNFQKGTPLWNAVFMATCLASAIGTVCMALIANRPFVMAPGMGLNSFFAVVVANIAVINKTTYENAFQAALSIILVEGIVFIILSVLNIREKIVEAIPMGIRLGIGPAIGLMLMDIGFGSNVGVAANGKQYYVLRDFFGAMTPSLLKDEMGNAYDKMVVTVATVIIGVIVILLLNKKGMKSAVLCGMLISSAFYWICEAAVIGDNPFESLKTASFIPPFKDMIDTTLFKFDFEGLFNIGIFTAITLIITFCMIDMFDTIGTLVGTASKTGMIDSNGKMTKMKEALLADAVGTVTGSLTGTSTVTTFVESASGVEAGGRTGLTALTAGILFLTCIFIAPIAAVIPAAATSSALIYVGIVMLQGISKFNFHNIDEFAPAMVMILTMPISGSIGHGIGLAMILYTCIKLFSGKAREVSVLTYVISLLFIIKFFVVI